jgi:prepilin-type N-terminal cleavage/methylation domain-containing protein
MKPNACHIAHPRRTSGFTLTELLVVILIVVVLASIAIPLAGKLKASSEESQCANQLRSWSNVITMYAGDNAGRIECRNWNSIGREAPSAYVSYWSGGLDHETGYRELAKMRCCPALKGKDAISGNGNSLTAYAMTDASGVPSSNQKEAGYSLASIKNPSRFVLMIEVTNVKTPAVIRNVGDYTSMVLPLTQAPKIRHKSGTVNALMGDFSIRASNKRDIEKNMQAWTSF